jgi:hypothetical protein
LLKKNTFFPMKILVPVLACWVWVQSYAQASKELTFSAKLFSSAFSDSEKTVWPLKNTSTGNLFISGGKYHIQSQDKEKKSYLIPKGEPQAGAIMVQTQLKFEKDNDKDASAGIALQVQPNLAGGYIVEINEAGKYRISSIEGAGKYVPLSKGKQGWLTLQHFNKDKMNMLSLSYGKSYLTFRSGQYTEWEGAVNAVNSGQNGLFINGDAQVTFSRYTLFGADSSASVVGTTTETAPFNTVESSATLLQCQKDYQQLQTQYNAQQIELSMNKQKIDELQTFIQENLDVKLQEQVAQLKKENEKLRGQAGQSSSGTTDGDAAGVISGLSQQVKELTDENQKQKELIRRLQDQLKNKKSNGQ